MSPPVLYYLVSHQDTIVHLDAAAEILRHGPPANVPLNIVLELAGTRGRLLLKGAVPDQLRAVSFTPLSSGIRTDVGGTDYNCEIENFDDGSVGIHTHGRYLSADSDGIVRKNRTWCRTWERYLLVRTETLDTILMLHRYYWLCHADRRIISPAGRTISFREDFSFGPVSVRLAGQIPVVAATVEVGDRRIPNRLHIVDGKGAMHSFSRFNPLIYFCVFGDDSFYDCLHLSLDSLKRFGRYREPIGVACDRSRADIEQFIPRVFRDRLIVSPAARERGWFNQYYLEHDLYDQYQPILYCDVDVVFDADITDLLIDILLARKICCATEDHAYPDLAQTPPRLWKDGPANYFGRHLLASDRELAGSHIHLGNAGVVGFENTDRVRTVNSLVKMIASQHRAEHLNVISDQPILNYVLHKAGLGDFSVVDKYCRLTRAIEAVAHTERRGMVHFHLASGSPSASAKAAVMRSYLEIVSEQTAPKDCPRAEIVLNASIPGQIAPVELERLAQLAHRVPSNGCVVEVGSLFGLSSWTLAKNARANVTVYCIDPWVREPWMAEAEAQAGQTVSLATFERNTAEVSNIIPLPGYSPRDFRGWRRSIDLVFEDSVHSNPVLNENLAFWIQFIVPGGVISGHGYSDAFPDVRAEVNDLANKLGQEVTVVGTLWSIQVPENYRIEAAELAGQ